MKDDPRIAALAAALHSMAACQHWETRPNRPVGRDRPCPQQLNHEREAATILAALPNDWCGHNSLNEGFLINELSVAEDEIATLRAALDGLVAAGRALLDAIDEDAVPEDDGFDPQTFAENALRAALHLVSQRHG
jgi:hypothetical protein